MAVTPDDLATYLGTPVDEARAQMLIDDVTAQALAVVTVGTVAGADPSALNLPAGAEGVIRAAVARIYTNPGGVTQEQVGPFEASRTATTGSLLSDAEVDTLRRLAGTNSGAFSVDPTPPCVGDYLPWWDVNIGPGGWSWEPGWGPEE